MRASLLIYGCIAVAIVYFILFSKTMGMLDAQEKKRFIEQSAFPRSHFVVMGGLFLLILLVPNVYVRIAAAVLLLTQLVWDSVRHHENLARLNFDPSFRRRLARISYLAAVAMALFLTGMILSAA